MYRHIQAGEDIYDSGTGLLPEGKDSYCAHLNTVPSCLIKQLAVDQVVKTIIALY